MELIRVDTLTGITTPTLLTVITVTVTTAMSKLTVTVTLESIRL